MLLYTLGYLVDEKEAQNYHKPSTHTVPPTQNHSSRPHDCSTRFQARPTSKDPSALEPSNVDLLAHVNGSIVISKLARGIAVGRGECDTVVDVQDLSLAAFALDIVGGGDRVLLGVDLSGGPDPATGDGGLGGAGVGGVRAKVVLAEEASCDACVELGVPVVGAVDDCEGVAGWVAEGQMDLLSPPLAILCYQCDLGQHDTRMERHKSTYAVL
jgi:hypothetical protein